MSAIRKNPQEEAYFHKLNQELIEKMKEKPSTPAKPTTDTTPAVQLEGKVLSFDQKKRRQK